MPIDKNSKEYADLVGLHSIVLERISELEEDGGSEDIADMLSGAASGVRMAAKVLLGHDAERVIASAELAEDMRVSLYSIG